MNNFIRKIKIYKFLDETYPCEELNWIKTAEEMSKYIVKKFSKYTSDIHFTDSSLGSVNVMTLERRSNILFFQNSIYFSKTQHYTLLNKPELYDFLEFLFDEYFDLKIKIKTHDYARGSAMFLEFKLDEI